VNARDTARPGGHGRGAGKRPGQGGHGRKPPRSDGASRRGLFRDCLSTVLLPLLAAAAFTVWAVAR